MKMKYLNLDFSFTFINPVYADIYPAFALRSVLGYQLKRMHCVNRSVLCADCPFNYSCSYAYVFETIIEKDTVVLKGRNRASHPFRIICQTQPNQKLQTLNFRIQLFGKAVIYVPHVVYAFSEAGKYGLFRDRAQYSVSSVLCEGIKVFDGNRILQNLLKENTLEFDPEYNELTEFSCMIQCNTPLRFKSAGKYQSDFNASSFLDACSRRVSTLFYLYSDSELLSFPNILPANKDCFITEKNTKWVNYKHWSGRQRALMELGGVVGEFKLEGIANRNMLQMLEACFLVACGKSTSFGFGDIRKK